MYSCLGQEGAPLHFVGTHDVSSRVVSKHEETSVSVLFNHDIFNVLEDCLCWFTKIVLFEIEFVSVTMVLEHIVERTKGHSRSMIPSSEGNIIVACIVGWQRATSHFSGVENVVDDLKSSLVRVYIIECKNCLYLPSPLMNIMG